VQLMPRLKDMTDIPVRIRPEIASLPAYKQGKQAGPDSFKLSSNENPFEPLPAVLAAMNLGSPINRYPAAGAPTLREKLGEFYAVDPSRVYIGAGSVSILQQLASAAAGPGDEIMYAWRSFEAYPWLATVTGATAVEIPLGPGTHHNLDAMAAAITDRTRVIIVCTPNNPTGPTISSADFDAFMQRVPADCMVLLDEAYAEFVTNKDAVDGLKERVYEKYPNCVVLRTFSKAYGLAGLRVGYAIGHERIMDAVRSVAIPLSTISVSEQAAIASLAAQSEMRERVAALIDRRERIVAGLRAQGWDIPDSQANFVWFAVGERTAEFMAAFEAAGIIGRAYGNDGFRISVGEEESIDVILRTAQALI
jgi:histidinol-phosphate aminotransferase